MATEGLRKHTTTLFSGVLAGQVPKWSGLLGDHKNLTNHQICFTAGATLSGGIYSVFIFPDADDVNHPVDTGLVLDLTDKDSAVITFTGVLRGILLRAIELVPETETRVSAVISSFSRNKRTGVSDGREERLDYVSSDLGYMSGGTESFSHHVPNHRNMVYHQLVVTADAPTTDAYQVRFMPDTEGESLETTVDTGHLLDFAGSQSAIIRFGGVIGGINLRAEGAVSHSGEIRVVLSSAVERFDEIVYDYIGVQPDLGDHVTNFNNPHQTSWDNLFNKPSAFANREVVPDGVTVDVPVDHQLLIWEEYHVKGTVNIPGRLVVLHDRPEASAIEPDFSYNLSDQLTQIDYDGGQQKTFQYNVSGQLEVVESTRDGFTLRKTFYYTPGGLLDYVARAWV